MINTLVSSDQEVFSSWIEEEEASIENAMLTESSSTSASNSIHGVHLIDEIERMFTVNLNHKSRGFRFFRLGQEKFYRMMVGLANNSLETFKISLRKKESGSSGDQEIDDVDSNKVERMALVDFHGHR